MSMKIVALAVSSLLVITSTLLLASPVSAWTATETKCKDLSVAGEVCFTSSFTAADGDTITIELTSSQYGDTISGVTTKKSTPARTTGEGIPGSSTDTTIQVTMNQGGAKTVHLWLWLTSGEHVGVNVHFR